MVRDSHKRRKSGGSAPAGQSGRRGLREEIAYRAARLIAEEGLTDFAAAKQKAARQMGELENASLPDNHEIEAALRTHQSLFQSYTQPEECRALRQIAVDVMRRLNHFSPWLIGSVLSGSANRFSPIELEIVGDDAKQLEMYFLNEGVHFDTRVERTRVGDEMEDISTYEITFEEIPVAIAFYPQHAVRFARRPRVSLAHARAQLKTVELLLV